MKKNIDEEGMTGTSLRQVYQEANAMHQLFAKSIPVSTPFITDVDDWILFMAQLGRVHPDNKRDTGVKPFWRFLYRFFKQTRSKEHTSELQSRGHLVCRLLLNKEN